MPLRSAVLVSCLLSLAVAGASRAATQLDDRNMSYRVAGGVLRQVDVRADSLAKSVIEGDTARLPGSVVPPESAGVATAPDSVAMADSQHKAATRNDSTFVRHNWLFRDSIPISRMAAISLIAPGFSQLYNNQPRKVPVLYATMGASIFFGIRENRTYQYYKKRYDDLKYNGATQATLDPWQENMINHNTYRQLLFGAAIASYIYFISDGVVNYPGKLTGVKKATTLSTVCPGAGQVYNGSFWKLPIVVGGLATMAFIIDWNNRGYQRFKLAFNQKAENEAGNTQIHDEFNGRYPSEFLRNWRNSYRRNRDMCIILTGAFYLLNIIDAHVDAHLKDYDISDDLVMNLTPYLDTIYASGSRRFSLGMSFNVKF